MPSDLAVRADDALAPPDDAAVLATVRAQLAKLARYMSVHTRRAQTASPLPPFGDDPVRQGDLASVGVSAEPVTARLPADDLAAAVALYNRIWSERGGDEPWLERWLLHLIGCTRDDSSVAFWVETLERQRAGDVFAAERRTYALAALASLAARHGAPAQHPAHEALRAATRHARPAMRAAAAAYLLRAYALARQSVPAPALDVLGRMARDDAALEPRYVARLLLEAQKLPVPTDHVGDAYVLAASRAGDADPRCVVALRAVHTLAQLHAVLQRGLAARAVGPYAFFLSGEYRGGKYEISTSDGRGSPPGETALGDLGLLPGHRFCYSPDGSAAHAVTVAVLAVRPVASADEALPEVVQSTVAPPSGPLADAPLVLVKTHVNGTKHYDAPAVRARLSPGDALVLRREPSNAYDDRAIEVLTADGAKLGYVPRVRNRVLAQLLDAGEPLAARLALCEGRPGWPYVVIEVEAPAVGAAGPRAA